MSTSETGPPGSKTKDSGESSKGNKTNDPSKNSGSTREASQTRATSAAPSAENGSKKPRIRYTREQLLKIGGNPALKQVPRGFDPNILKPSDSAASPFDGPPQDGPKRGWRNNTGGCHPPGGLAKGQAIHSRLVQVDSIEGDQSPPQGHGSGQRGRGWGSGPRQGWRSDQEPEQSGQPGSFNRRNSRSDVQGRWDANKDDEWQKSKPPPGMERPRVGEGQRWPSFGHRDGKDKPQKKQPDGDDNIRDPEWVQEGGSEAQNPSNSLKERAAAFEQEKMAARKQWVNKPHVQGQRDSMYMTDEDIEQMRLEQKAAESAGFNFDSFKEAFKQGATGDIPPLPQSFSTVDEIEKSMKSQGRGHVLGVPPGQSPPMPSDYKSVADIERDRTGHDNQGARGGPMRMDQGVNAQNTNMLLNMLRGAVRPPQPANPIAALAAAQQQQQQQQHLLQQRLQLQRQLQQAQRAYGQNQGVPLQYPNNENMVQAATDNVLQRLFAASAQRQPPPSSSILTLSGLQGQQGLANAQLQQNLLHAQQTGQRSPLLAALHQINDARASQAQAQAQAHAQAQAQAQAQAIAAQQRASYPDSESLQRALTGEHGPSKGAGYGMGMGVHQQQQPQQPPPQQPVANPMGSHLIMPDGSTIMRPHLANAAVQGGMVHPGMLRPGSGASIGHVLDQFSKNPVPIIGGHPVQPGGHQMGGPQANVNTVGLERFFGMQNQQGVQGNSVPAARAQNLEDLESMSLT